MVEVITSEPTHVVYLNNPFVDKITLKSGDIPQEYWADRAKEYDHFVHLAHSCEARHALFKASTAFWWPQDFRRKLCAGSYLETVHDIAGVAHEFGPLYLPTEEEMDRARRTRDEQIGGPYVAWFISGSRIDKIYPHATMAIHRIIKELDIPVVMFGAGGKNFEMAKTVEREVKRTNGSLRGLHLALSPDNADPGGEQSWLLLRSLAQVLAADLVITPETSPAWACAMEPMPKIVMVSHASLRSSKPWPLVCRSSRPMPRDAVIS
jgi:ADP-heptose:LPS heptosyltransferase